MRAGMAVPVAMGAPSRVTGVPAARLAPVGRAGMAAAVRLGLTPLSVQLVLLRQVVPAALAAMVVPAALAGLVAWRAGEALLPELRAMVVTAELRAMGGPALTVATVPTPSFLHCRPAPGPRVATVEMPALKALVV